MIKFPSKLFYISILPSSILYLQSSISYLYDIKLSLVVRDLAQTWISIGVGMISNIGILLWGAAIYLFIYNILRKSKMIYLNYFYLEGFSACFV